MTNRLALVTGASSGIGQAYAKRLGAEGYDLIVVGRRRDRLDDLVAALPSVKVEPLAADLATQAGIDTVATEFHTRQGMDLSALPRMSAEDVVTASRKGLTLGEVVCAPGVERADLLDAIFTADLAAFGAQSPRLASRYQ